MAVTRELTGGEKTLMGHLTALEQMVKDMAKAKKGTYTKDALKRVSARATEAREALKAESAKVEAAIKAKRKRDKS